ncbi:MAG: phosphodiesterase, partial [Clostridia bacterium]|nr:phosphodiesterase [Clostridia bacterium]
MKLFIASDLHGSALWCARMLDAYRASGACRLVLLGDLLYHGPRNDLPDGYDPKAIIAMLNPLADEILAVRGNCDPWSVAPLETVVEWNGIRMLLLHGHTKEGKLALYYSAIAENCSCVLYGHSHIASIERYNGILLVNPGSLSLPRGR